MNLRATPTYTSKSWTKPQYEQLLELHGLGKTYQEIAPIIGKTCHAVYAKLIYLGLRDVAISPEVKTDIVQRLKTGQSPARIHKDTGVAKGKIRRIKAEQLIELFNVGKLSDTEAAYMAGIVDGEGCIMLSMRSRRSVPRIILMVANTNFNLIRWIKDKVKCGSINDHIRSRHKDAGNRKDQMRWTADGRCAVKILEQIQSYMVCKAEQSRIVRSLYDRLIVDRPYTHSEEELIEMVEMVKTIHRLNKRGRN